MRPATLLTAARRLVDEPVPGTERIWARAAVHLTRQALEGAMRIRLSKRMPRIESVPFRLQLLCLATVCDEETAARAAYVWSALSRAAHFYGYELPPTARGILGWIDTVEAVLVRLGTHEDA